MPELIKLLKYLLTINNIDFPIMMIEVSTCSHFFLINRDPKKS